MVGWPASEFWTATLTDITDAIDGFIAANCPPRTEPPTKAQIADLKKRYPDGGSIRHRAQ